MNNTQPTYKRQRFLLAFIRQLGGGVSSTDLQKLVFLHTMEDNSEFYEFLPYMYGSYSFQLAEDIDILRRDGFLAVDGTKIKAAGDYVHESPYNIPSERGNNLIRKAYRAYPYYTVNSEMISRLFGKQEAELFMSERQKYRQSVQTLFTIGYEGHSIEAFINELIQNGVKLLCDVRKNPLSRKFGFSKGKLERITGTVGIKYVHIPDLGIESDKRATLETAEDYANLFSAFGKTLPNLDRHLEYVYTLLSSNVRIALMCYEREAPMCHRHVIRDYIKRAHEVRSIDL
ncbi:MAG: DUF488 domain-containing protein [Oscillospiraceae bacterium]|nr:DUF488 domain-containing protein [Oscillospiraceae bacterium]